MSRQTRTSAILLAASLLLGSVSLAAGEAPRQRPFDLETGRSVLAQMFDWVRSLVGATRRDHSRPALPASSSQQKDGPFIDPNGHS